MEFIYIFKILFQRKWIIIGSVVVAIIAAFLWTMNQKPSYKSIAQISTGFTISEDIQLSNEGFNVSQIDMKFNNAMENITSPKVLSLLSYKLILHDLTSPTPFRKLTPKESEEIGINKEEAIRLLTRKRDSIQILNSGNPEQKKMLDLLKAYQYDISSLLKTLYVDRHQRTDYIDIIFRSENPDLSAFVVNSLVGEFQKYFDAFRRERSVEAMASLDSLVKKRKNELDEKIALKSQFLTDSISSTMDPKESGYEKLSQIRQYENYLVEEQGRVQDLTYQISSITSQLKGVEGPAASTPVTSTTNNSELLILRKQYNELYDEYTRGGSENPALKKRLDEIKQKMNVLSSQSSVSSSPDPDGSMGYNQRSSLIQAKTSAEGMLKSSSVKMNFYRSKLAELNSAIQNALPGASAKLDKMDKEIEMANLEYSQSKEKLNLAANMEGIPNKFSQTLFGQPAIEPEPRGRIVILGLSGLSALILSSLVFVFAAYIDQSIKTPSQFSRQTGLKLLGFVNLINLKNANIIDQVVQFEEGHRDNLFRELLRKLRYEIENSNKRVILFTSTEPQQGKTTLIQALAFSLSLGKKRVLILDTNFCNNDLTVNNKVQPTLEQFSGTEGQMHGDYWASLVTQTGVENVDIIGCKGGDYTPTEILPQNHLLNYLPDLLNNYDYIFMEGAPLNGFTDTKELVQYADGVLAIFSATIEVKQSDKDSIKFLHDLKGKFMGAILNKVQEQDINL